MLAAIKSFAKWMTKQGYASMQVQKFYSLEERRERGVSRDGGTIELTRPPIDVTCWTVLKDSMDCWPTTETWARRRVLVGMLFYAGLSIEEARVVDLLPLANGLPAEAPYVSVPSRKSHGRDVVYLCTELLAWFRVWFDLGGLSAEHAADRGALGTRDRCGRDVRLALALAATHAESRGLHDVASRLSRCGVHALFRALPTILDGCERVAWELTGATSTRWNTTYSYIYKRGPLSVARYRELCARLSAELSSGETTARDRLLVSCAGDQILLQAPMEGHRRRRAQAAARV